MTSQPVIPKNPAGPLFGVRVVDISQFILGPLATQILGDMGADVIKVETPAGDPNRYMGPSRSTGMAAMFLGMNRSKRSAVLDLKASSDRAAFHKLIESADVFVHSLRADGAQRLGVDYPTLLKHNPRLIHACAPGYRSDGPYRNRPAYDDVVQGESGIADLMFQATGESRYLPTVLADKFCGHVLASSISMALYYRERTGKGQSVEVPMLETMLSFNLVEHLYAGAFDEPRGRPGYDRAIMRERRPSPTLDGALCWMATTDIQWKRLLCELGRPDLVGDPRFSSVAARSANFPEIYRIVGELLAGLTTADARSRLEQAEVPNAPVRRLTDLESDDYLNQTGFFHKYTHPTAGALITPSIAPRFSEAPPRLHRPPPALGEHTQEVLAELGISPDVHRAKESHEIKS